MVRFKVNKMGCGDCVKSVTRAVQAIEPDARVEVDLGAKLLMVSGVSALAQRIAQAIAAAGYPAEPMLATA
jgi:copper chaperone